MSDLYFEEVNILLFREASTPESIPSSMNGMFYCIKNTKRRCLDFVGSSMMCPRFEGLN